MTAACQFFQGALVCQCPEGRSKIPVPWCVSLSHPPGPARSSGRIGANQPSALGTSLSNATTARKSKTNVFSSIENAIIQTPDMQRTMSPAFNQMSETVL